MIFVKVFVIVIISIMMQFFSYKRKSKYINYLLLIYVIDIILITLGGRIPAENHMYNINLFSSYRWIFQVDWDYSGKYVLLQNIANIIIFFPVGQYLAYVSKRDILCWHVIGIAFSISLCIETLQYFTMLGTFEIDDLLNNIWGALIGVEVNKNNNYYNRIVIKKE